VMCDGVMVNKFLVFSCNTGPVIRRTDDLSPGAPNLFTNQKRHQFFFLFQNPSERYET